MGRLTKVYWRMKASRHWPLYRWPLYAGVVFFILLFFAFVGDVIVMPLVTRHGDEFPTPALVGKNLREAETILKILDLRIEIESYQHSPSIPEGVVLDQYPPAQAMVKADRRIKVVVSSGARITMVPFLRGYTVRQSQFMLDEAGLMIGGESYTRNDSLPPGVVVGSIPAGGGSVPVGTIVNVLVNENDEFALVTVPILVGENIKKAENMLDLRGLVLGSVYHEVDSVLLPGTVVNQSVAAGLQVRRGSPVDLTITSETW